MMRILSKLQREYQCVLMGQWRRALRVPLLHVRPFFLSRLDCFASSQRRPHYYQRHGSGALGAL